MPDHHAVSHDPVGHDEGKARLPLRDLFLAFSKIGCLSFGGPIAAIGLIEQEMVSKRRWVDGRWFTGALALTNMIPGPTATEMSIYIGYVRAGFWGGVVAGLSYVYPAFLMMLALSALYFTYGMLPAMQGFIYGLTPAAVGVLVWAAARMAKSSLPDAFHLVLFCAAFVLSYYARLSVVWVILLGGVAGIAFENLGKVRVLAMFPLYWLISPVPGESLNIEGGKLFVLFAQMLKAGALLFGGGYVIVPFMNQDFVERLHWLTPHEFLVAFALGKATPGPISIAATFVGYRVAGILGACVATVGLFLPGFIMMLTLAPVFEWLRKRTAAQGFMKGMQAAAIGAILASASDLIQSVMADWTSVILLGLSAIGAFYIDATVLFLTAGIAGLLASRLVPLP